MDNDSNFIDNNQNEEIKGKVKNAPWLMQEERIEYFNEYLHALYIQIKLNKLDLDSKLKFISFAEMIYVDLYPTISNDHRKILEDLIKKLTHYYNLLKLSTDTDEVGIYSEKFEKNANELIKQVNIAKQRSGLGIPIEEQIDFKEKLENAFGIELLDEDEDDKNETNAN